MVFIYCIMGTLKFDRFLLKLDRLLHSSQPSVLPVNPVRTTSAGCLHGSRSHPFLQAVMDVVVKLSIRQQASAQQMHTSTCALSTDVQVPRCQMPKVTGRSLQGHLLWLHVQLNKQRFVLNSFTNTWILREHRRAPTSPLTPTVQCLGSSDSRMVTLSRALSSPVILALAIGRSSEASI